ncbi:MULTISPECIES: EF-hand domain-containing protein [Pseudoxanthomonas]|uniref:Ca2+-binding EF-hand superfamily protein n=1 Tax=Pseudoxanthomonas winnipegensis TaxID=2480810 RepID=A0AAW8GHN8_9GAMM|nr:MULTISPECIES: EF-hand domain-containing protein [Pseudoxanthomonas]MDQ1120750.1 Ca2+-binding EF-hand superfamily protein [Pseudoxanthomonas winnipegensis]MDR6139791.1 Ca2+-binding EF-hand superfamily protein [Pseudoxanthomonas sp. SORGH_AS_0997]
MKTRLLTGACLCALLAPMLCHAQHSATPRPLVGGHGEDVQRFIAQHTENGEQRLTWEAFDAFRRARFDATDGNHDGVLDEAEYVAEFAARTRQQQAQEYQDALRQTDVRFRSLDTDQDGAISRAEFDAAGAQSWTAGQRALSALDAPGVFPAEERAARRNRRAMPSSHTAEGFLALYDTDLDGLVGRQEFDLVRAAQFERGDRDGDGRLSAQEYREEFKARLDAHLAALPVDDGRQTRVRFGVLDKDKDGRMTFEEYQVSGKRTFDLVDRNHDGVVDLADARLPAPPRPPRPAAPAAAPEPS